MKDTDFMPFGKDHKGKKMGNVPAKYLLWCYDQAWIDKYPDVKKYIEENKDVLEAEEKKITTNKKFKKKK